MTCSVVKVPGGGTAIVCHVRGRRRPPACKVKGSPTCTSGEYECDGCDIVMCRSCAVSVKRAGKQLDFCPRCFAPAWRRWLRTQVDPVLHGGPSSREERRRLFREWAHAHPEAFDCIKLSEAAS